MVNWIGGVRPRDGGGFVITGTLSRGRRVTATFSAEAIDSLGGSDAATLQAAAEAQVSATKDDIVTSDPLDFEIRE